jgi:hypothetical protein
LALLLLRSAYVSSPSSLTSPFPSKIFSGASIAASEMATGATCKTELMTLTECYGWGIEQHHSKIKGFCTSSIAKAGTLACTDISSMTWKGHISLHKATNLQQKRLQTRILKLS